MNKVVTRFPPSPTGQLHIGRARTALFNYLYAKQHKGTLVFRLEDTDKERSRQEFEENIIESLNWLGISYDQGPFRQSERTAVYVSYIHKMIESGAAYEAENSEKGEGRVVRFKNPNKKITFQDIIRGEVTVDTTDLGDFVIARNKNEPVYHLTVVVDDFEMGVTHVIRGEDGISNTPRQILIQEGIGAQRPQYAHIPLILAPDRSKLSGRHGAVSVTEYRDEGYLPEALINYLALLGWNPGTDQEIFSIEELIQLFKLENVQKAGAIFDTEKLRWINREHLRRLPEKEFIKQARKWLPQDISHLPQFSEERFLRLIPELRERVSVWGDIVKLAEEGELEYFFEKPDYFVENLIWKKSNKNAAKENLFALQEIIANISGTDFSDPEKIKEIIWPLAEEKGRGDVLWPLRYALSGRDQSPDPFSLMSILDKEETVSRLDAALEKLS